jgi:mannose-6-phosphate isomerase-like protein (cupin superfamily)
MFKVLHADDLKREGSNTAVFQGVDHGSGISFFSVDNEPGQGPGLHKHPYSETWLVLEGHGVITADGEEIQAGPGAIVVVGADTPHKFRNAGTGRLKIVCIHASPEFVNEMLPDEDAGALVS